MNYFLIRLYFFLIQKIRLQAMTKPIRKSKKKKIPMERNCHQISDLSKSEIQATKIKLKIINNNSEDKKIENKSYEITIRYNLKNKSEKGDEIKLFGSKFYQRNRKNEIKLIIDNEEKELV